jgi:hypothetical protein
MRGKFLVLLAAMGIVVSMGSKALAQADPYDPSSPNYVGNSSKVKVPKYNATLSATAFQSLDSAGEDEFGGETGASYEVLIGRYFNKNLRGDVTIGYSHPFDLDAERPDRWEFEDVSLRLLKPSVWKSDSKSQNLALIGSLRLPTSGTSQDASLITQARVTAQYTYRYKKWTLAATPTLSLAYHEFETADEDGFLKNSPVGITVGGSARYGFTRKLGFVAAASATSLLDYDFNTRTVQSVSGSLQYLVNQKTFVAIVARWRDLTVTNNALFDDSASLVGLNVGYTL